MNALKVIDRYGKEVIQVSTPKQDINVQYLYDKDNSERSIGKGSGRLGSHL